MPLPSDPTDALTARVRASHTGCVAVNLVRLKSGMIAASIYDRDLRDWVRGEGINVPQAIENLERKLNAS